MEQFTNISALMISQKKEWGEILTGFETKNRYAVMNQSGELLFSADETGGNFLLRSFLKALRPFSLEIRDLSGALQLTVNRPFRLFFHEIDVYDANGVLQGRVKREFSFLRRIYTVFDASGKEIFQLFGPLLHPWTFEIRTGERMVGKITKKWSGLFKEGFTDADTFGVQFPEGWQEQTKATILGAVFLIDFVHFENNNDN